MGSNFKIIMINKVSTMIVGISSGYVMGIFEFALIIITLNAISKSSFF